MCLANTFVNQAALTLSPLNSSQANFLLTPQLLDILARSGNTANWPESSLAWLGCCESKNNDKIVDAS